MFIKVEFPIGIEIETACSEAVRVANQLNVAITFDFNGVDVTARHGINAEDLAKEYRRVLKENLSTKVAMV